MESKNVNQNVWLGLRSKNLEWMDFTALAFPGFSNWAKNMSHPFTEEECVQIIGNQSTDFGYWNQGPCDNQNYVVCETSTFWNREMERVRKYIYQFKRLLNVKN